MLEELKVVKGEKVAWTRWSKEIESILTVVSISPKGTITVENTPGGERGMYDKEGYSKGQTRGQIRKLEEGEEEKFLAVKQAELAEVAAKKKEKEEIFQKKLEKCRKWVEANAWNINSIQAVNCTLYVVSLPIPNESCTLVLRFDENSESRRTEEYRYSVAVEVHRSERSYSNNLGKRGYISGGQTSTNSAKIAPLEIAALWVASWIDVDKLEV